MQQDPLAGETLLGHASELRGSAPLGSRPALPTPTTRGSALPTTRSEGSETSDATFDLDELASRPLSASYTVQFEGTAVKIDSQDWRTSRLLQVQIVAAWCNYILFGLAEQTIGTIIPRLEDHYHTTDSHIALIFLLSTAGYFVMALALETCHRHLGVKGVGIMGTMLMAAAYMCIYWRPPFAVFVLAYFFSGIGFGTLDACFNGWMGTLVDLNQLLGILHGCYGIGCMILPPLVTLLVARPNDPWRWNDYYLVLSVLATLCMAFYGVAFRHDTPSKYRLMVLVRDARKLGQAESRLSSRRSSKEAGAITLEHGTELDDLRVPARPSARASLEHMPVAGVHEFPAEPRFEDLAASLSLSLCTPLVWALSVIMLLYVGAEVSFGTWLITFLTRVKHRSFHYSSYMATTFWTGLTAGRILLGFVTAHYFRTELDANLVYIAASLAGHVLFCLAVLTQASALVFAIVFVLGLFVGPIFPTTITASLRILPVKFHATGVGFICAFGGGGAAVVPFLVGLVAQSSDTGLRFYPAIVASLYFLILVAWVVLSRRNK